MSGYLNFITKKCNNFMIVVVLIDVNRGSSTAEVKLPLNRNFIFARTAVPIGKRR